MLFVVADLPDRMELQLTLLEWFAFNLFFDVVRLVGVEDSENTLCDLELVSQLQDQLLRVACEPLPAIDNVEEGVECL